jgi:hypothetical protein
MNLFKENVILTKKYTRYGGDSESVLGLVTDHKGYTYLYSDAETFNNHTMGLCRLFSITSCPEYTKWLFSNSMDLLNMIHDDYPYGDFYNDRTVRDGRKKEFLYLLKKLNEDLN